tara:strand:+ start:1101 stop:1337 length:237 start_codon:yes stop_codon:yes gene_type:complete
MNNIIKYNFKLINKNIKKKYDIKISDINKINNLIFKNITNLKNFNIKSNRYQLYTDINNYKYVIIQKKLKFNYALKIN